MVERKLKRCILKAHRVTRRQQAKQEWDNFGVATLPLDAPTGAWAIDGFGEEFHDQHPRDHHHIPSLRATVVGEGYSAIQVARWHLRGLAKRSPDDKQILG
jgi:hypothetical protein